MASPFSTDGEAVNRELSDQLDALERVIERCKTLFEQYFLGIQKTAPWQVKKDVERRIRELGRNPIRNTGLRFRLSALSQRFTAYNAYWRRILRQMEQGRYDRDVKRAISRSSRKGQDVPDELMQGLPKAVRNRILKERNRVAESELKIANRVHSIHDDDVDNNVTPQKVMDEILAERSNSPIPGMSEEETRSLHRRYMQARKFAGKNNQISYEKLMKKLQGKARQFMNKRGVESVKFDVALRDDGGVVIKAKPGQ